MIELSAENFESEVIKSAQPVLVDFWATWCQPCKKIAPLLDELAHKYAGKIKFAKVNVESAPLLAQRYGVRSIPTLLIFKAGKVMSQSIGTQTKPHLEEKIREVL